MILEDDHRVRQRGPERDDRRGKHEAVDMDHVRLRGGDDRDRSRHLVPRAWRSAPAVGDENVLNRITSLAGVGAEALDSLHRRAGLTHGGAPSGQRVVVREQRVGTREPLVEREIQLDDCEHLVRAPFTCSMVVRSR